MIKLLLSNFIRYPYQCLLQVSFLSLVTVADEKMFIAGVMSGIKNEKHKQKKLKYIESIFITQADRSWVSENGKEAFIKADQLYSFKKKQITYTVMGYAPDEITDTI